MSLDGTRNVNDVAVESRGVVIVFEKDLGMYLEDAVVSYSDSQFNQGFKVNGAGMSSC